jgi:putative SOS response-associated peptidase YedK
VGLAYSDTRAVCNWLNSTPVCTHFAPTHRRDWVKEQLGVDWPVEPTPEAYPGYAAPIVIQSHRTGRVACGMARFGLIPAWAKDDKIARHTYNARSETADEKPSFRTAWRQRQYGLVLVDHFYEPFYDAGKPVRHKIARADGQPFGIACLWDRWRDPASGELVVSFSMLTVNADQHPVMNRFHPPGDEKRTPVIISPDEHHRWLGADTTQARQMMSWAKMPELVEQAAPKI